MSSPSEHFECRWQASRLLLIAYALVQGLALLAVFCLDIPFWLAASGAVLCLVHTVRVLPRSILLNHSAAITGLRRDQQGWSVLSRRDGWQPVQLCQDSLALPLAVILRFRLMRGARPSRYTTSCCIPRDALTPDVHRRLRVRLKFSRRRWAVPE